jgi:hypothetical protein
MQEPLVPYALAKTQNRWRGQVQIAARAGRGLRADTKVSANTIVQWSCIYAGVEIGSPRHTDATHGLADYYGFKPGELVTDDQRNVTALRVDGAGEVDWLDARSRGAHRRW